MRSDIPYTCILKEIENKVYTFQNINVYAVYSTKTLKRSKVEMKFVKCQFNYHNSRRI